MIGTLLLSLTDYLIYVVCMMVVLYLVVLAMSASSSVMNLPESIRLRIALILSFVLKNFLIFLSHYTLPSSVSELIAILLCLAGYLVCMMIWPVLLSTCALVWSAALGKHCHRDQLPDWIYMIMAGVTFVVTDKVTSYYVDPALISEFLIQILTTLLFFIEYLIYLVYIACLVALLYLLLLIANGAIQSTRIWWPELVHTSIVGLALLLLNMMWGSPFQKPSIDSDTRAAIVGLAAYLVYIVCSMVLSYNLFGASLLLKTFVISLTLVLLDMLVKPSSVSQMITAVVGLTGTITTALLALFFLLALSFVVFMFLHTWAEILLPSARRGYPMGSFVSIICLTFMVMKPILGMPVEEHSIFSDMKAGLHGITDMINEYHSAYVVVRNLTFLVIPLLSMESRRIVSMYQLYTTAAFIVAVGLVLTLPPGPAGTPTESPASTLVTDDFVQQTITSFVTSQIKRMDGEVEQLTDS